MLADDLLEDELRPPPDVAHAQAMLDTYDPALRLRRSIERPGFYVLERRCRRAPAPNAGMGLSTDLHVQARDGYIHVSLVHPELLCRPWCMVIALREEGADLWAEGGAERFVDELEYEEAWLRESRKRRRRDDGQAYYREMFDVLGRMGNPEGRNERTRFANPGRPAIPPAVSHADRPPEPAERTP